MTSSDVPSTHFHSVQGFSGGFFFPATHTEVDPLTTPTIILFFAAFIEAASLSPNNISIILNLLESFKISIHTLYKLRLNKIAARWPAEAVAQFYFIAK
jgi:hypothetical protein